MNKFKVGDKVIKNPLTWIPSEFDSWGAGEGVGEIVKPPFHLDGDEYDVVWPTGRAFQREEELVAAPIQKVLIISGRKQAGKNTISNFVSGLILLQNSLIKEFEVSERSNGKLYIKDNKDELYNFEDWVDKDCWKYVKVYGYADELKRILKDLFRLRPEQVDGTDEEKNTLTEYHWENMVGVSDTTFKNKVGPMTARELIQYVGTEIFRKIHTDIHIEATLHKILQERPSLAVIEGCRFPNELFLPKSRSDLDIKIVRLTRTMFPDDKHSSETSLEREVFDWNHFDAIIDNQNMNIEQSCKALLDSLRSWNWVK